MFKELWKLLLLYLVLGAEGDGEDTVAGGDGAETVDAGGGEDTVTGGDGDDALPDTDLDSLIDTVETGGDDAGKKAGGRENDTIRQLREDRQRETEARIRAEAERDAERRMRQPAATNEEQVLFEQEEAKLRDPNVTPVEKWQITSNRTLRANTRAANQALATAADGKDRNEFDRLAVSNPKVYKLYSDKVEKALSDMRAKGQDAPRLALLRFMIGNDVMEGKLKSKPKAATTTTTSSTVNRGKPTGARSDVSAKGQSSERQKRIARLENVAL